MSEQLYLSPNAKIETELPFFVVYEREDTGEVAKEIKGKIKSAKEEQEYEFVLVPQGPGASDNTVRYMGELSLVDPGSYEVNVAQRVQSFEVFKRADNLSFLREFGVFFIGTAILAVVILCWTLISKKKRLRTT